MECNCRTHVGEAAFDCPTLTAGRRDPFGAASIDDTREHLAALVQSMHSNLRMALDPGARQHRDRWIQEANAQLVETLHILRD